MVMKIPTPGKFGKANATLKPPSRPKTPIFKVKIALKPPRKPKFP